MDLSPSSPVAAATDARPGAPGAAPDAAASPRPGPSRADEVSWPAAGDVATRSAAVARSSGGETGAPVADPSATANDADEPVGRLLFPAGLPGFPDARRFQLRPLGAGEFALLESEERDGPRFVVLPVADPAAVFGPAGVAEAASAAGVAEVDLAFLAIVTLASGAVGRAAFVNLRAPIVVDTIGRTARQIVLADPRLPLRHPLELRAAA